MKILSHKGHRFNPGTEAATLKDKGDIKALEKHLKAVETSAKELMARGDALEVPCTAPGGRWEIGQTVEGHIVKVRREDFERKMRFQASEDAVFRDACYRPIELSKESIKLLRANREQRSE